LSERHVTIVASISITTRTRTGSNPYATARAAVSAAVRSRSSAGPTRLIVRHNVVVDATGPNNAPMARNIAASDIAVAPSANAKTITARVRPG
jgi:hypothetical protein